MKKSRYTVRGMNCTLRTLRSLCVFAVKYSFNHKDGNAKNLKLTVPQITAPLTVESTDDILYNHSDEKHYYHPGKICFNPIAA